MKRPDFFHKEVPIVPWAGRHCLNLVLIFSSFATRSIIYYATVWILYNNILLLVRRILWIQLLNRLPYHQIPLAAAYDDHIYLSSSLLLNSVCTGAKHGPMNHCMTRPKISGAFGGQNPEKIQFFNFFKMEARPTSDFRLG